MRGELETLIREAIGKTKEKVDRVARTLATLDASAEAAREESLRLQKREAAARSRAAWLSGYVMQ